jgi:hypothetical protein
MRTCFRQDNRALDRSCDVVVTTANSASAVEKGAATYSLTAAKMADKAKHLAFNAMVSNGIQAWDWHVRGQESASVF